MFETDRVDVLQEDHDDKILPTLVVMAGPPGCGKSTLAEILKAYFDPSLDVVSSDRIRKELFGNEAIQENPGKVFAIAYDRVKELLGDDRIVIFDATNCRKAYRKILLDECKPYSSLTICLTYTGDLETCLRQNLARGRQVPDRVVKGMYYSLQSEPPSVLEGFDAVLPMNDLCVDILESLAYDGERQ